MDILITILIVIVSLLLMGIVLIQNSKGGGLASGFSSSNQIVGVQKTTDFLEKGTWGLAIALLALCLVSTMTISNTTSTAVQTAQESEIEDIMPNIQAPAGFDPEAAPAPEQ